MKKNITFSQKKLQFATCNDVSQELSKVKVEDNDIVDADEGPTPINNNDEDEAPYQSFVQDSGNEPLEVDRMHRAFA